MQCARETEDIFGGERVGLMLLLMLVILARGRRKRWTNDK